MRSIALYSPEPAKGWLPWGALAPFLCILIVALPTSGCRAWSSIFNWWMREAIPPAFRDCAPFCSSSSA